MVILHAALDQDLRVVRGRRRRRDHVYGGGQLFGSLMRHLRGVAPIEVRLLAGGVIGPTRFRQLVTSAGAAQGLATPSPTAVVVAVDVPVVAPATEKHQPRTPAADDKA